MQCFVQVTFTAEGASAIRAFQEDLAALLGVGFDTRLEPHITLGAAEVASAEPLREALHPVLSRETTFGVTFAAFGTFGAARGILFLSPTYNQALFGLYERVHDVLKYHALALHPHYVPAFWTPHCTLLMDLDAAQLAAGCSHLVGEPLPLTVWAERLELCEYPSLTVLGSWNLHA